jgi:serine/threonine-protein kinase
MTPERYQHLCDLFERVQPLSPEERSPFLDHACAGDPSLRADLEQMLYHDARAWSEKLFQEPCAVSTGRFVPASEPDDALLGRRIGPYVIEEHRGSGGMGSVYRARRADVYRQQVALKVVRPGLDRAEILRRFDTERQALADLEHPSIGRLLDGGTTDDGRPYFVMEYIDGPPLNRYAEGQHLSTRERVGLVQAVAAAIQYAHEHGVVHRDLKPANVLVAADGTPKVTDFGLAKRLQGAPGVSTAGDHTQSGAILGTPSYMAPEQAMGRNQEVGPAADVYAVGALLYELLTGRPPFRGETPLETLRQVRDEEPVPPSRLHPRLARDLETICLKCLAKEPGQRYGSAAALAEDLENWQAGRPIRARRVGFVQRLGKWARRKPAAAALVVLGFLAVVATLASALVIARQQAVRQGEISAALADALQRRDEARAAPQDDWSKWTAALTAAKRVEGLLAYGTPAEDLRRQVQDLVQDLEGVEQDRRFLARLEEVRLLQTEVKDEQFDKTQAVAEYAAAFREFGLDCATFEVEAAAAWIRQRTIPVEVAGALDYWAVLCRYYFPEQTQNPDWRRLLEIARRADPDPWRNRVRDALTQEDRQALKDLAASPQVRQLPPPVLVVLANALTMHGDRAPAIVLLRRAQPEHPNDLWVNLHLANLLKDAVPPQPDEAIRFFTAAVALRPQSPGIRLKLGNALVQNGRRGEAIAAYQKAIELKPDFALAHCNLGGQLSDVGRLDEAIAACHRAIELKADFAGAYRNLGFALLRKGQRDKVPAAFQEAATACRKAIELKPDFDEAHFDLGNVRLAQGQLNEASAAFQDAIKFKPNFALYHYNLGIALEGNGQLERAIAAYQKAIEFEPDYAEAHCNLGSALQKKGFMHEALTEVKQGHELGSRRPGWPYKSAQWVKTAQRWADLEARLPAVLRDNTPLTDATQAVEFAQLCQRKRLYAAAAQFYQKAFTIQPALLAHNLGNSRVYDAACVATLAGCGQGEDGARLSDTERAGWRRQAVDWLRVDLTRRGKHLAGKAPPAQMQQQLSWWLRDPDLAGIRDAAALAKLPEAEQARCRQLWADVAQLLHQAASGPDAAKARP